MIKTGYLVMYQDYDDFGLDAVYMDEKVAIAKVKELNQKDMDMHLYGL